MKLSFVIPAHNEEKYIGKCLNSIFAETAGKNYDVEIIVVNNCSTDKTAEEVKKHPDVKLVYEPKQGLPVARQRGFLEATGDLIANVDADTMLPHGWAKKVFEEFSKDKNLAALSGPHIYYDLPKKVKFFVRIFYYISYLAYLINGLIFRRSFLLQGGNFVVRRTALESIGGFNTNINFYGEDTDLAYRIHKVGKVKFTFKFPIYASGRRLATEGALTMGLRYGLNYFWMIFFKRPLSKTAIYMRPEQKNGMLEYRPQNKKREWLIGFFSLVLVLSILAAAAYAAYLLVLKAGFHV